MGFFESSSWSAKAPESDIPKCGACGLFRQCQSPKMLPSGRGNRKVLFVGEAPGKTEDDTGLQFVGDAGRCLREILDDLHVDLNDCWLTNAAICRPPANEIDILYVESCRANLMATIKRLKPSVIIALGLSAVQSLLVPEWGDDIGPMARWAGWAIPSPRYGAWVCPTYHPSFVLRNNNDPALVRIVREHLRDALAMEGKPVVYADIKKIRADVEIVPTKKMARRMLDLAGREGLLAFDYETTGLKPERKDQRILSVSFCYEGRETFAGYIDVSCHDALRAVLLNERLRKVASNKKYEHRWGIQKLGTVTQGWDWDTMLAAHVIDNRQGITSIKFQSYIHFGVADYGSAIRKYFDDAPDDDSDSGANSLNVAAFSPDEDPIDRLRYNGTDSIMEYKVMEKQKETLQWKL